MDERDIIINCGFVLRCIVYRDEKRLYYYVGFFCESIGYIG